VKSIAGLLFVIYGFAEDSISMISTVDADLMSASVMDHRLNMSIMTVNILWNNRGADLMDVSSSLM